MIACRELPEDTLLCSILSWIQASQIASQPIRSPTTPVLDPSVLATMKTIMQLTVEKMDEFSSANGNLRNQKAKALILPILLYPALCKTRSRRIRSVGRLPDLYIYITYT